MGRRWWLDWPRRLPARDQTVGTRETSVNIVINLNPVRPVLCCRLISVFKNE